jgi:hypothetical protein
MLTPVTFAECTRLDAAGGANYFILILFAAFLGIALWVIRQQSFLGKNFFVTANLALLVWLFAALMELFSATTGCKVFWSTLAFPGIGLLSVSWFLFIYRFIRNESDRVLQTGSLGRQSFMTMKFCSMPTLPCFTFSSLRVLSCWASLSCAAQGARGLCSSLYF